MDMTDNFAAPACAGPSPLSVDISEGPPPSPATSPQPAPGAGGRLPAEGASRLAAELQAGLLPLLDPARVVERGRWGRSDGPQLSRLPYAADECVRVFRTKSAGGRARSLVKWLRHTKHMHGNMLRAVRSNNAVRMRSLVLMGADVNARDETGRTALHTAATMRLPDMLSALLSAGARPDLRDTATGRSALHCAVSAGCGASVRALLSAGASVSLADGRGLTPLQLTEQRIRLCRALQPESGADAGAPANGGRGADSAALPPMLAREVAQLLEIQSLLERAWRPGPAAPMSGVLSQIRTLDLTGRRGPHPAPEAQADSAIAAQLRDIHLTSDGQPGRLKLDMARQMSLVPSGGAITLNLGTGAGMWLDGNGQPCKEMALTEKDEEDVEGDWCVVRSRQ